jgi:hypothetical protein
LDATRVYESELDKAYRTRNSDRATNRTAAPSWYQKSFIVSPCSPRPRYGVSTGKASFYLLPGGMWFWLPEFLFSVGQSWREIFIVPRLQESFALSRMDPLHDNLIPRSRHPLYKVVFVQ